MTYGTKQNIWAFFVFSTIAVGLLLLIWLTIGIIKKNSIQIKSSVKFLINLVSSFVFAIFSFVYYGIWVTAPYGEDKQDSINILDDRMVQSITKWYLWALLWLSLLLIFNLKDLKDVSWHQTTLDSFARLFRRIASTSINFKRFNNYNGKRYCICC